MILFETTESVIEILWDIVLAIYIVRIAFAYFLLNFLSGLFLLYLSTHQLTPAVPLTTPQSELVLVPFLLLSSIIWARAVIVYYEVPRVKGFRLASGLTALGFLVMAWMFVTTPVMWLEGVPVLGWVWETDERSGLALGAVVVMYTLMMVLQMGFEKSAAEVGVEETSHGHEKKRLVDAVPTVSVIKSSNKLKMQ
ncbi:hypothetical protein V8F20_007636 [Naviculisporaceae sp. PSN 640]